MLKHSTANDIQRTFLRKLEQVDLSEPVDKPGKPDQHSLDRKILRETKVTDFSEETAEPAL